MGKADGRDTTNVRPLAVALARFAGAVAAFRDEVIRHQPVDHPLVEALHVPLLKMNEIVEAQARDPGLVISFSEIRAGVQATMKACDALTEQPGVDEVTARVSRLVAAAAIEIMQLLDERSGKGKRPH